jgi:hypothetical protein
MNMQAENEDPNATSLGDKSSGDIAKKSNAQLLAMVARLKLRLIGSYILDGFAPFVAAAALIMAVFIYNGNHASEAKIVKMTAMVQTLNENLSAAQADVEKLKTALAQEKTVQADEGKSRDERAMKIVQSVSKIQGKMKISPTLEEQLRQPVAVSAVSSTVGMVPAKTTKPIEKAAISATEPTSSVQKSDGRMSALKQAIKKFNQ